MADTVPFVIDITPEQQAQIETLTREHGYQNPAEYLLALVNADEEDQDFDEDPEQAFHQAWHEAMTGQTFPVSTLWDNN